MSVIVVICMLSVTMIERKYEIDTDINDVVEKVESEVIEDEELVDVTIEEATEELTEKPDEKTVEFTKTKEESKADNDEPKLVSLGTFKLTAYCDCYKCCNKTDGITATGTVATQGRTIAVDPKVIPYGTNVIINGHTYVAEDCGGGIKKNEIDIYFSSHKEALRYGVQYAEVFIEVD